MRKTIFLLSLITLLASCENELDNNYEINQDANKVSQDSVLPSKDTIDSDTTPLERSNPDGTIFFQDGNCTYYSTYNSATDTYSYPPSIYFCEDPETGEVYRETELCECYYLQPDGPWQRHRCKKHND